MSQGPEVKVAEQFLDYIGVLVWPGIVLFALLRFTGDIRALIARVSHAQLPGGTSFDFGVEQAKQAAEKLESDPGPEEQVGIEPIAHTEANERLLQLGLRPSPSGLDLNYYRSFLPQSPSLALAGLRLEMELWGQNLAEWSKITVLAGESMS